MEQSAIRVAIDLLHVPSRVQWTRSQPLPKDITPLLQIAAGDVGIERAVAEQTGRSRQLIYDAALFFVEQILLAPDADAYRRLGLSTDANQFELRRNLALLLKSTHPDRMNGDRMNGDRSVFTYRIIDAWDALKTPERRAVYDARMQRKDATDRAQHLTRVTRRRRQRQKDGSKSVVLVKHSAQALDLHPSPGENIIHRIFRYLFARV